MNVVLRSTLDKAAISMAVICGIHCLVTPVLLVALPLLATTFWVDENFHLWMLLFVIPTTTLAVWSGCRRHKDKWVALCAVIGIGILSSALIAERIEHGHGDGHDHAAESIYAQNEEQTLLGGSSDETHAAGGGCCELHPAAEEGDSLATVLPLTWHALLNTLGGCFLVAGHVRNFLLCRKNDCSHCDECSSSK
ncbi:MerC domain-containing protein [Pelagicoccus albus]|uniref:MerC domain-containing protein n=1 Tax=Pelagicoccus albus TaxID=415222 RepID=A0A7X1E9V2_9BACT|nr:MerC domain-containing protein [Pelagicoccus albus]MBC2607834.1 MerC domain-containing protein [Pelagicoccus albus]